MPLGALTLPSIGTPDCCLHCSVFGAPRKGPGGRKGSIGSLLTT